MKKYLSFAFVLLFALTVASSANAVSTSTPQNIRDRIEERRENIQEKRAEIKQKLNERKAKLVESYAERMKKRLEAAIARVLKLIERAEGAVTKFDEKGVDTTKAETFLDEANKSIDDAKDLLEDYDDSVDDIIASSSPKESFGELRELVKSIIAKIKEAHRNVVGAISSLNAGKKGPNATTTDED